MDRWQKSRTAAYARALDPFSGRIKREMTIMEKMEGQMDIKKMIEEFEGAQREVEAGIARRKPDANKLTKVMRASRSYYYFVAGENAYGYDVKFCVADHVNVAGYVLVWRQVEGTDSRKRFVVKRNMWAARKTHTAAMTLAKRRAAAWSKKLKKSDKPSWMMTGRNYA